MMRVFIFVVAAALCFGCKKSEPPQTVAPAVSSAGVIARIHWLGKKKLERTPAATNLIAVWNLPESLKLENRALDKLSSAPWRPGNVSGLASQARLELVSRSESVASRPEVEFRVSSLGANDPQPAGAPKLGEGGSTNLLRPLLDDLVAEEVYAEARAGNSNQPGELVLAVHLSDDRAALWETNLAAVLESLTGIQPERGTRNAERGTTNSQPSTLNSQLSGGWLLKKHHAPGLIELKRAGEWTIVGAAQDHNLLVDDVLTRIALNRVPYPLPVTNFWLEASVDPARLATALATDWNLPDNFPAIYFTAAGDGQSVRTRGELNFPVPIALDFTPWNLPTNFITQPISEFTAVRGIGPWLGSLKNWTNFPFGSPPNQFFFWGMDDDLPMLSYFAVPVPDASNRVSRLADFVLQEVNPWLKTNSVSPGVAQFKKSDKFNGLEWEGVPFMTPFLKSVETGGNNLVLGGFFAPIESRLSLPSELLQEIFNSTNLVAYSWELTGRRVQQWLGIGQFLRLICDRPQLPPEALSVAWFKALASKLGPGVTEIRQTGSSQLSFASKSTIGLSALELHLLADWLESPEFPHGFYTMLAPLPVSHGPAKRKAPPPATPMPGP